jgi:hypothetical protein
MSNEDHILLEWSYTPEMFFEEPVVISREGVEIRIEGGRATATVDPDVYDAKHGKRDELHEVVRGYFRARQVVTHKGYELPKPSVARLYPDGRVVPTNLVWIRMHSLLGEVGMLVSTGDSVAAEFCRRARIDAELAFGEAVGRLLPRDPVLRKLLDSYDAAVNDPDDELIHLYEVRDALSTHFKSSDKARKKLGIPKKEWNRLGEMANTMPLRQGRHRGVHDELRDATAEELGEARGLAREFIEAYVRWLNGGGGV